MQMAEENYRELAEHLMDQLDDRQLLALHTVIETINKAALCGGIDLVNELRNGHSLSEILEMIAGRQGRWVA